MCDLDNFNDLVAKYILDGERKENAIWCASHTLKARKYFSTQRKKQDREITCQNYERAQKILHNQVGAFIGNGLS
jgi:hypothetical protein